MVSTPTRASGRSGTRAPGASVSPPGRRPSRFNGKHGGQPPRSSSGHLHCPARACAVPPLPPSCECGVSGCPRGEAAPRWPPGWRLHGRCRVDSGTVDPTIATPARRRPVVLRSRICGLVACSPCVADLSVAMIGRLLTAGGWPPSRTDLAARRLPAGGSWRR
jgi:hypothetical protein